MSTKLCPIIKLLNERLQDLRSIPMLGRPLTTQEESAYYALLEAKFHAAKARAYLQQMEMKQMEMKREEHVA